MVWSPKKNGVESKNKLGGSKHKSVTNIRIPKNKICGIQNRIQKRIQKKISNNSRRRPKFFGSVFGSVFGSYSRVRQNELFPTPKSIPKTSPKSTPKNSPPDTRSSPPVPPPGAHSQSQMSSRASTGQQSCTTIFLGPRRTSHDFLGPPRTS